MLKVVPAIGSLRSRPIYHALRLATLAVAQREFAAFRIIHISIQRSAIHLLVEAGARLDLSNGMQRFQMSAAKQINAACGHRGTVFPDRFLQEILDTPARARAALNLVLNGWRKHGEDRNTPSWKIDPYSTGHLFDGWKERDDPAQPLYEPLVVYRPKSWLLREGWRDSGGPLSYRARPP